MNNRYYTSIRPLTFLFLSFFFFLFSSVVFGQVGIGTTNPNGNALLEIDATTTAGGLLLPRVALTNTTSAVPLSAHIQGMTVYNTVAVGDVTPGYYYNDGSNWVRIATEPIAEGWGCAGNVGTVPGTNFIGTVDNNSLRIKTNDLDQFDYTIDGRLRAFTNGNEAQPIYSWESNPGTGMFQQAANVLGFSVNAIERLRLSSTEAIFNEQGDDFDFRIESDGQSNMFFVDASTNRIGINTNSPTNVIHFRTTGENNWLTYWENNNSSNGGIAQFIHTNSNNPNRVLMGATNYAGNSYVASGVVGLALGNSGSGGEGVTGFSNSPDGIGTYGGFAGGTNPSTLGWAIYADGWAGGLSLWQSISDKKLKKNIKTLKGSLSKVIQLRGVEYFYDNTTYPDVDLDTQSKQIGFIAQEVEKVFPNLVKESNIFSSSRKKDGSLNETRNSYKVKTLSYSNLMPVLVEAVKEQQQIIDSQEVRIAKLEVMVQELLNNR